MFRHIVQAAVLGLVIAAPVRGAGSAWGEESSRAITISDAWLRATPNGAPVAGGYVTLANAGAGEDRLLAASLEGTAKGEVHTMSMQNGAMHMARLEAGLAIAPGATIALKPGGDHLMFFDPTHAFKEGERVPGTLTFAKAGTIAVTFTVAGMAAKVPPAH